MSLLRRISAVTAATVLAVVAPGAVAHADFTFYRTNPHVIACWEKVNAYGGVYQVHNGLLNGTTATHTARVRVNRPGVGIQSDQTYRAVAGEWKLGAIAHVALVPNDEYLVDLNGTRVVGIPAHGVPFYMNHCKVRESTSVKVRQALSFGLAQLDSIYVGCAAGSYRFGAIPTTNMSHDGRTCGQTRSYKQPAGVKGYDCSGLVVKMFQQAGITIPWTSSGSMKANLPRVDKSRILPGDLLAMDGHVAIYLGDGDGDGVASVLEAKPVSQNADGTWLGVVISNATAYLNSGSYTAHRVPGV